LRVDLLSVPIILSSIFGIIYDGQEVISDQKKFRKPSSQPSNKSQKSDPTSNQFVKSTLQIHSKLFEKHRVMTQKKLFQALVVAELRYHCKAVEELSDVLQELSTIQEDNI